MFGVDDVLLATLAAQVGSAVFNSYRGNKHSKELAAKQQALEEKIQKEGMQNAREEFAALCSLQREIEQEMQRDRIDMIKSNHANAILEKAYSVALDKWPLLVPPYVVKNECLLNIEQSQRDVLSLNCIMTTSMDSKFNRSIFPNVEEAVAEFCYTYWNVASERSIRFYQRAWKDNITDIGAECRNLHALMKDVPTLVLSPQVRHEKLTFRFFWWGLSTNPQDVHIDDNSVFDPELSNPVYEGMKYSDDDIRIILSELVPKIEAFISYFADLYYWTFYKKVPTLPNLLYSKKIVLNQETSSKYMLAYGENIVKYIKETKSWRNNSEFVVELTKSIMQNNPDDNLIYEIHKSILCNKDCLAVSDLPLLNGLLEFNSSLTSELSQYKTKLEKEETITIHAFSNSDEMFYNARKMYAYAFGENNRFNVKFIDEYSFIACVTDEHGKVVYCNPKSRYCLFVTSTTIPLAKFKVGTLDISDRRFYKGNPKTSPCDLLVYDSKSLTQQANRIRAFLQKTRDVFSQLSPILSMPADFEDVPSTITIYDIKRWILENRINENEFRLALSYDKSSQLYCMVGSFACGNEIIDDRSYISFFKYIDDSIKSILKYNHTCKLNIK